MPHRGSGLRDGEAGEEPVVEDVAVVRSQVSLDQGDQFVVPHGQLGSVFGAVAGVRCVGNLLGRCGPVAVASGIEVGHCAGGDPVDPAEGC